MLDLKTIESVLSELESDRGIPRAKVLDAVEIALATAYKKEYGKRGQIIRARFDKDSGATDFFQVKIVVDENTVRMEDDDDEEESRETAATPFKKEEAGRTDAFFSAKALATEEEDERPRYDPEKHIMLSDAMKIKKDSALGDEITFPLEPKDDFGRIAAQTAKQVIIQKIREAEKVSVMEEFAEREGEVVSGTIQRVERGNVFVDFGRTVGMMPYDEQIPGERFKTGDRIRAYLYSVEEGQRGVFLRLSRSHPKFLAKLFELETPELAAGTVLIKEIAREAGSRSKIAVASNDAHIDPVGSLVGGRGVRVSTVMSELHGEKIDVIEWSEEPRQFIEDALSPASVLSVSIDEVSHRATVEVSEDQQSLAIGKGGQNVRLAAKLTGWRIDVKEAGVPAKRDDETADEDVAEASLEDIKKAADEIEENKDESVEAVVAEDILENSETVEDAEDKK